MWRRRERVLALVMVLLAITLVALPPSMAHPKIPDQEPGFASVNQTSTASTENVVGAINATTTTDNNDEITLTTLQETPTMIKQPNAAVSDFQPSSAQSKSQTISTKDDGRSRVHVLPILLAVGACAMGVAAVFVIANKRVQQRLRKNRHQAQVRRDLGFDHNDKELSDNLM